MLLAAAQSLAAATQECTTRSFDENGRVVFVYDGDTVRLADGRRVRLLGIDTPEIGRDGAPSEAHAEAARAWLQNLLGDGAVRLRIGEQAHDRYGRQLAHLMLPDGRNVQQALLHGGLAVAIAVPPNVALLGCYLAAERHARSRRAGVWASASYGPLIADRLTPGKRGLRLVRGRVESLSESRSSLWLEMGERFSARVPSKLLAAFGRDRLSALVGRVVTVRGFLYGDGERTHLTLRHPSMLEVAE